MLADVTMHLFDHQELEALKSELEDSLDTTNAMQEVRVKREQEMESMKKSLELETSKHDAQLQDVRTKHSQQLEQVNDQLDQHKKVFIVA